MPPMKYSDIIQWNPRGIKNKRLELQILADQCRALLICLGEIKLPYDEKYIFKGYEVFQKNKDAGPQGIAHGGVAILARPQVAPIPVRLNTNFQAVAISVKLHRRITVCSIYIPPGAGGDFSEADLERLLSQLPKPYLLLGDMNAHNPLWYSRNMCPRGNIIEQVLLNNDCYFLDKDKDTHVYSHEGVCQTSHIDLSIASLDLIMDFEWGCYDSLMRSDHFPIWLRAGMMSRPRRLPKWIMDKADWTKFREQAVPRMEPEEFDSASEMGQYTKNFIIDAAKEAIPKTSGQGREYSAIWFNTECWEAKRKRQDKFKDYRRGRATRAEWKREEAIAQAIFKRNKLKAWRDFVDGVNVGSDTGGSYKDMWRKIGLLTNKYKTKEVHALKIGGRVIDEKEEIANCIAREMERVSSEAACSEEFLRHKHQKEKKRINFESRQEQDYNVPITRQELDAAIKELKDTAPGPDEVHNKMLQNLSDDAKTFLLQMLNKVFLKREFPDEWRLAHVIPILKEGKDPLDPASYRPISLTSCLCKLLEKILAKRFLVFLNSCGLLDCAQNGSRQGRDATDSLVALENEIHRAFIKNRLLVCIFIDLMKAYDTCWIYLILRELYVAGLRGHLGFFIAGFMKDRKFQVRVGDRVSAVHKLELGVPQGSVMSVILFMVAVNTVIAYIPATIERSLYVDDMRFSIEVFHTTVAEGILNNLCKKLVTWMNVTGFRISLTKSKVLVFHNRTAKQQEKNPVNDFALDIKLGAVRLEVVTEYKFLGLIFDQKLTWRFQIAALKRKGMKALGILKLMAKNNKTMKRETYIGIYKTLVQPVLDYGSPAYGTAKEHILKSLDPVHHAALRICTGAFRTSNRYSLYVEAFVPSLWDRREYLSLCYMYRAQRISSEDRQNAWEDDELDDRYSRFKSRSKSFGFLARKSCLELQLENPQISKLRDYPIPPWLLSKLQVCVALGEYSKLDTTPEEFRHVFGEHQHETDVQVYTDGSKMQRKVGAGIFIKGGGWDKEISEPLGGYASVFTAELVAIKVAILQFMQARELSVIIYSDSRSALQALLVYNSNNRLVQDIQVAVHELAQKGITVSFCWVPSHVGIEGNEMADKLAKAALQLERENPALVFFSDWKGHLKEKMFHKWKDKWQDMVDEHWTQLRGVQENIHPRKWGFGFSRAEEIKITRLRIGHTRFARDYYFKDNIPPECDECGELLTVQHVLLDCGNYYHERLLHFKDLDITLPNLLNNPINFRAVLNFFQDINLYGCI